MMGVRGQWQYCYDIPPVIDCEISLELLTGTYRVKYVYLTGIYRVKYVSDWYLQS